MYWDTKEFGVRLKKLRTNKKLTQEALAEKLSVSWEHLSRIERGSRKCSVELIMDIAAYFDISIDYLLLGKQPEQLLGKQPEQLLGKQPEQLLGKQPEQLLGKQPQRLLGKQPQQSETQKKLFAVIGELHDIAMET